MTKLEETPPPITGPEEMLQHQRYIARRLYDIQDLVQRKRGGPGVLTIAAGVFLGLFLWLLAGLALSSVFFGAVAAVISEAARSAGGAR